MKNFYVNSFYGSFAGNGKASVTVNFDTQQGETLPAQKFYLGEVYKNLPTPIRAGYTFMGWYDKVTGGNLITDETPVNCDTLILYAKWEIQTFTVRFLDWDNTELKRQVVNYGANATPPTNPTRVGYTFSKWDKEYINIIKNIDIQAQYTINTHTLNYNANGGVVSPNNKQLQFGAAYGVLPTPTKVNKNFLGWFTLASGGTQVSETNTMPDNDVTIYAHWGDIQGRVVINLVSDDGASLGTVIKEGVVGETEIVIFEEKIGYTKPENMTITYQLKEQQMTATYIKEVAPEMKIKIPKIVIK